MVTGVDAATARVTMLKLALVARPQTVTLAGTVTAGLLLASATCAPAAGAGPVKRHRTSDGGSARDAR